MADRLPFRTRANGRCYESPSPNVKALDPIGRSDVLDGASGIPEAIDQGTRPGTMGADSAGR